MDNDLVLLSRKAAEDVAAALRQLKRPGDPRARKEHPWVFPPGLPIPILNTASSLAPQGAWAQLARTMDATGTYFNIEQPKVPELSSLLVIVDAAIAPGATGLGWRCDGCDHPVYLGSNVPIVGGRYGPVAGQWYGAANPLGPATITQLQDPITGLPVARLHGERGDCKIVVDTLGGVHVARFVVFGLDYSVSAPAPGSPAVPTVSM